MSNITPPLKTHGGKRYLADWIISHLPPHRTYVEPHAGGLAVLLAKEPEGVSEVVNDLNGALTNFWRVLQSEEAFGLLERRLSATPFYEREWEAAGEMLAVPPASEVMWAWAFFVRCRQSLAGRMKTFAPVSTSRTRRGMNEQVSAWLSAVEGLPAVHDRLKRVLVLNRDGCEVIRQFDVPDAVLYVDPPYVPTTRTSPDVYAYEMTTEQHADLLDTLLEVKHAHVALSGYRCPLYDQKLAGWRRVDREVANHAAGGRVKRKMVESLWLSD